MTKEVIAYLHTHWDREWYKEFEAFRIRLLSVFDRILNMLDNNDIPSFYFDGQVSAIQDYLEMRPEKLRLVKQLINNKKLFIGPFYCLIDEFLTDKICFKKNLEIGLEYAKKLGCKDFIGYLPDTFGHSQNVPPILKEFNIDKCIVWRGCGDFPAEFKWYNIDTVNLIRGYFNDFFSAPYEIEKKAKLLKEHLDKIAKSSENILLLPIGADHLGVENDIAKQIEKINEILKDDYEIKFSSPFEYFEKVKNNFDKFKWNDELRDNSKTFILQGCYSSRLDLKKQNIECSYLLDLTNRFVKQQKEEKKYNSSIKYGYKLLLQNQAHDSICGCSTDDVHNENILRFKKIKQITNTIISELKLKNEFFNKKILNLSDDEFSGIIHFYSTQNFNGYEKTFSKMGFDEYLLADTQKIPITEDYVSIYKYSIEVKNIQKNQIDYIIPANEVSDLQNDYNYIKNVYLKVEIVEDALFINNIKMTLRDFIDNGDSYNEGPVANDIGTEYKIFRSKIIEQTPLNVMFKIDFENKWDIISLFVNLEKNSQKVKLFFDWENTRKNHCLKVCFTLNSAIKEVYSEDMNTLIKRTFNPYYNIRENLPTEKGIETKTNTAPMQRGLLIDDQFNNIGIITKGLTQYEIEKEKLYIPILRATGVISNPKNPARTTPAGPPLEVPSLQQIGKNTAEMYVFFGDTTTFNKVLNEVYNYIIT